MPSPSIEGALFGGWGDTDVAEAVLFGGWDLSVTRPDFPVVIHEALDLSLWLGQPIVSTSPNHTQVHQKLENELPATQAKLGLGDSFPTAVGMVLVCTADGVTEWMSLADAIAAYGGP